MVNSYGLVGTQSQALALSAYGERQGALCPDGVGHLANVSVTGFYGCSFTGYQDTVLTDTGTQIFAQSYIEGAVSPRL